MHLRCLLFTSDGQTAVPICHVLADLAVEVEHCSEAAAASESVSTQPFQIVIVDWDNQPDAAALLKTARERKASERALTLAIVSDDPSVPKALQAGANSILRKPLMASQVKDTLATARDLLRARGSAAQAAAAGATPAHAIAVLPTSEPGNETALRAGEFLQTSGPAATTQYDTESDMQKSMEQTAAQEIDPLKDLEPVAASVEQPPVPPPPVPSTPDEPRGLQWYLNQRAATAAAAPAPAPAPASAAPTPAAAKPELLGFETSSYSPTTPAKPADPVVEPRPSNNDSQKERKAEAELFAYIEGDREQSETEPRPRPRLGKGAIGIALLLAACAVVAAPQAPWHPQVRTLWARERLALHAWLNPQPVTSTTPSPAAHEDFGRAGDEYKLPVVETIPDATTDPSQIRVVPMVDPTAKKPNPANPDPNLVPADATPASPGEPAQPADGQSQGVQVQSVPAQGTAPTGITTAPAAVGSTPDVSPTTPPPTAPAPEPLHRDPAVPVPQVSTPTPPPAVKNTQPRPISVTATPPIPSSLKSQMASMTPEASGNKAPESAMPSIEPVVVPEGAERALLADQPAIAYPANAKAAQGTVVLQVLIGRDGTVQDAKFLQGSLAFARTAIDGIKQWKFKPYNMNGRPVSVQTLLTITFKPGQ